jgi:hypothetical protein
MSEREREVARPVAAFAAQLTKCGSRDPIPILAFDHEHDWLGLGISCGEAFDAGRTFRC